MPDYLDAMRAAVLEAVIAGGPPERLGGRILDIIDAALALRAVAPSDGAGGLDVAGNETGLLVGTLGEPTACARLLDEARATIEAMSGDAADLHDLIGEAAALRTCLAHVLVRTHDSGCGTCDAARALLTAEHELPSRSLTEPTP